VRWNGLICRGCCRLLGGKNGGCGDSNVIDVDDGGITLLLIGFNGKSDTKLVGVVIVRRYCTCTLKGDAFAGITTGELEDGDFGGCALRIFPDIHGQRRILAHFVGVRVELQNEVRVARGIDYTA